MVNPSRKFFSQCAFGCLTLVGLAACASSTDDNSGSPGTNVPSTGGGVGVGGATATGGAVGVGGAVTTGGAVGVGGTVATGGVVATGGAATGTGGTGGNAAVTCFQVASTSFLDFDTYDGENLSFLVAGEPVGGVYMGPWELTDETDEASPDPAPTYALEMPTGFGDTGYALKISDQEAKNWGGGVGFWMSNCVDAATYSGIRLQVRGTVPTGMVGITVSTRDTVAPSAEGVGACMGTTCADASAEFAVGLDATAWTQVDLPWSAFTPGVGSGGVAAPLSGFGIMGLTFTVNLQYDEVGPKPGPYDLTIDEIGYF
jgi:hypothetical protein